MGTRVVERSHDSRIMEQKTHGPWSVVLQWVLYPSDNAQLTEAPVAEVIEAISAVRMVQLSSDLNPAQSIWGMPRYEDAFPTTALDRRNLGCRPIFVTFPCSSNFD